MATYYPFTPSQFAPYSFQPTLDGNQYNCTVTWNLYGQRYYLNVAALDGTAVVTTPLVASPSSVPLASLTWANGTVTAVTQAPHGYAVDLTIALTIENCAPAAYNTNVLALVVNATTLTWPLLPDPGPATAVGLIDWTLNLVEGYFETSTLIFRNQQFEVAP
ncbi:MAG TPA: hypothetical protein VMV19_17600 [Xanthobacteraceae bacterium]|nr:hypothetical protein [Xanthobacteraceae bacterium]